MGRGGADAGRRATYRVQLQAGFDFHEAARLVPYLAELGISHLYCSPYLQAAAGSTHGYDVVDPTRVSEELGGEAGHAALSRALRAAGMRQLLDIVPNHMAIDDPGNRWWWDVLADGPASPHARFFDIDWDNPEPGLHGRVLLPILGDHVGRVLAAGELRVRRREGALEVRCYDRGLPLNPAGLALVLGAAAVSEGAPAALADIVTQLTTLPTAAADDAGACAHRRAGRERITGELAVLLSDERNGAARAVDSAVQRLDGDRAALDQLLRLQHYRLAHWRTALQHANYRRFFDINTLGALRAEDPQVFEASHALIARLVDEGVLDGVRCDHVDGLRDPAAYLQRLRHRLGDAAWILVEKILAADEELPPWPVDGATGYEFAAVCTGVLIDPAGAAALTQLWEQVSSRRTQFAAVAHAGKVLACDNLLAGDVDRLTRLLAAVCDRNAEQRDHTTRELRRAVVEMLAALPVYRTYVVAERGTVADEDVRRIEQALQAATARARVDPQLLEFFADVLLRRAQPPGIVPIDPVGADPEVELVMRFQQTAAAVTAKGVEDTAFYRYHRLVALNEVGASPGRWGCAPDELHAHNQAAAAQHPQRLVATSTHDTKRSEDVRARLCVLSEIPGVWRAAVARWTSMNERHRQGRDVDPGTEYLYYQTLVGAWPVDAERAAQYMEKATHEAKLTTSWVDPDPEYDAAVSAFVIDTLANQRFVADLEAFVADILEDGRRNALVQTVLKLTAPGVADIYQGCELWDLSLVDPDNRRPVDYARRTRALQRVRTMDAAAAMREWDSGLIKMFVTQRLLALRARAAADFCAAAHTPVYAVGERAAHLLAYRRGERVLVAVPRCGVVLRREGWGDTQVTLPPGQWRDVFTQVQRTGGTPLRVEELFSDFPVCVLTAGVDG